MRDDLQRLADGELSPEEARELLESLPAEARREARALQRLAEAAARLGRDSPSPDFAARAMARARSRPAPRRRAWTWLLSPRLSPLAALGGAAAAALLGLSAASWLGGAGAPAPRLARVRLEYRAPLARAVSAAGDFNGWRPEATRLTRAPGGLWTAEIPLAPGRRYQYMLVVDGAWITDPSAAAVAEDGFGGQNSVLDL
ncbi:MAG TPA: isoamylase early set domain-containing protein [Anaeromyxobacteraceae bacterium]|nr:isoamylase early set domain-containing protein [Anaeromyxobacteraceae bacterium]